MQPTYLPWIGYFDLIDQADVFVFLDDAQFSRKSWHQRNRIRTPRGLEWLTVPVIGAGRFPLPIRDVRIAEDSGFPRDHLRALEVNYARAPHFPAHFPRLREILSASTRSLVDLNVGLIGWLAAALGITTPFETSSTLAATGRRADLMVDICRRVGATRCLSPIGAADYLAAEYDPSRNPGFELVFHAFSHPEYDQVFRPFMPFASAVDLLFNEGPRALGILRSGRAPSRVAFEVFAEQQGTAR